MKTKTLSERIEHLERMADCYGHNELSEAVDIAKQALRDLEVSQEQIKALRETDKEACQYMVKQKAENQALLAKNGELEASVKHWNRKYRDRTDDNLKFRKDNEELEAKVKELEGKVWIAKEYLGCMSENEARVTGSRINSHFADAINNMAAHAKKALRAIEQGKIEPDSENEWEEQASTKTKGESDDK